MIKVTTVPKSRNNKNKLPDVEVEEKDCLKEFTVKIDELDINKFFITTVKAKTKESAINICEKEYKGKNYSFRIL